MFSSTAPSRSVEAMEAQLNQQEERARDRAVALRAILRDDKLMNQFLSQYDDGQLELKVGWAPGGGAAANWWSAGGGRPMHCPAAVAAVADPAT